MSAADWTHQEQSIAKQAFETGKQRSIEALIVVLREQSALLDTPESIWRYHDFLSSERYQYEGRAEFDTANILFNLADMIKQNLITYEDLEGLDTTKLSKIEAMAMF